MASSNTSNLFNSSDLAPGLRLPPNDPINLSDSATGASTPMTTLSNSSFHMNNLVRDPRSMPKQRSKDASTKFTGKSSDVKYFIEEYCDLCELYNVTNDRDKCKHIIEYLSSRVRTFIRGLKSYQDGNWRNLEADFLLHYDADLEESRYNVRDLDKFVKQWKKQPIKTLTKWRKYERQFVEVGEWLQTHNKITEDEASLYFWRGIYKPFRMQIKERIQRAYPLISNTKVYP